MTLISLSFAQVMTISFKPLAKIDINVHTTILRALHELLEYVKHVVQHNLERGNG